MASLAFLAADNPASLQLRQELQARYAQHSPDQADVIVAIGGDGFILETLHSRIGLRQPVYGIRSGQSVGFLCNDPPTATEDLPARIDQAQHADLPLLEMQAETIKGKPVRAMAINEVSLLRETRQTAKLCISIDGKVRMRELVCDGVLVATPAGSTAYNLSAHGSILPLSANVLAITAISAFRPRRWRGAVIPQDSQISIEIHEAEKRPVLAVADSTEVRDVRKVSISVARQQSLRLLFDPEQNLEERILREQFVG